jgi:hypothetical protein
LSDKITLKVSGYDNTFADITFGELRCQTSASCSNWAVLEGVPPPRSGYVRRAALVASPNMSLSLTVSGKPTRKCSLDLPASVAQATQIDLKIDRPNWDAAGDCSFVHVHSNGPE